MNNSHVEVASSLALRKSMDVLADQTKMGPPWQSLPLTLPSSSQPETNLWGACSPGKWLTDASWLAADFIADVFCPQFLLIHLSYFRLFSKSYVAPWSLNCLASLAAHGVLEYSEGSSKLSQVTCGWEDQTTGFRCYSHVTSIPNATTHALHVIFAFLTGQQIRKRIFYLFSVSWCALQKMAWSSCLLQDLQAVLQKLWHNIV